MNSKIRSLLFACVGLLFGMSVMYVYNNFIAEKKNHPKTEKISQSSERKIENNHSIDELSEAKTVIDYVKKNHQLPDYYITKNEARKKGWNPSKGNLCEVLPGKAIGGDHFSNFEKQLPVNKTYFEADVNYHCGKRNADRIVFTKQGAVYLSRNHYKSFEKQ